MADQSVRETVLGPIPSDWDWSKLGDVTFEGSKRNRDLAYERFDVLSVDNVRGLMPSDRLLGDDFSRYKLVQQGQFAYNPMRLNVGSIGLWRDERVGLVSPDYIVFGCKEERLDSDFFDLFRNSAAWNSQIQQSGQGSIRIRYYYRHIAEFQIPLPPLPEQRAISHILRTVQRAKEAVEKNISASLRLKVSLLRHLFTYGSVPFNQAGMVSLRETAIGPMPDSWRLSTLGEVGSIARGKFTHRPRNDPRFYGGTVPFIQTGDVAKSNGKVTSFGQTLNERGKAVSRVFPKGTIVLTIAANIGDTAVLDFDCAFPDSLVGITPENYMDTGYLAYYLQTQKQEMDRLAPRGTQKNINIQFLRPWPVPVPPLIEQRAIARSIDAVNEKLQAEQSRLASLGKLFGTLLHSLITGKVRVREFALA